MGFKNMKRDDHGHVISNDETDGQKCQHGVGGSNKPDNSERENLRKEIEYKLKAEGNTSDVRLMAERRGFKIENGKVVEDLKSQAMADRATGGSGEVFDDDYEEEFAEDAGPVDRYGQPIDIDNLDMYDDEDIYETDEKGFVTLPKKLRPEIQAMIDAQQQGDEDLIKAINAADDDVLDNQFGKDTPERKLVGAMKGQPQKATYTDTFGNTKDVEIMEELKGPNGKKQYKVKYPDGGVFIKDEDELKFGAIKGQPAGEATSDEEWQKRHNDFLERGKSTWNQKLQKGDEVTFEGPDGKEVTAKIGGFWKSGELVDDDTYEEGKDNHWHDFRAVGLVDKDGKNIGSINVYQIKKHNRQQQPQRPAMTQEQRQAIREQINKMVASLDDARSLDEAWDIEEGIKELEEMLKKYKGK